MDSCSVCRHQRDRRFFFPRVSHVTTLALATHSLLHFELINDLGLPADRELKSIPEMKCMAAPDSFARRALLVKLKGRLGLLGHILVRLFKVLGHDDVAARQTRTTGDENTRE